MDPIWSITRASSLPSHEVFRASISGSAIASSERYVSVVDDTESVSAAVADLDDDVSVPDVALSVDVSVSVEVALAVDAALSVESASSVAIAPPVSASI